MTYARVHSRIRCSSVILTLALTASALLGSGCGDDDDGSDDDSGGSTQGGAGAEPGGRGGGGTGGSSATAGTVPNAGRGPGAGGTSAGAGGFDAGAGGQAAEDVAVVGDRRIPFTPETDREFIHFFIEHHEMAIHMAEIVVDKGSREDVRQLAEQVIAAQTSEIEALQDADEELQTHPEPPETPTDPHHEADLEHMMSMTGTALDRMFLLDMIPHHAAGLTVAHRARAPDARRSTNDGGGNRASAGRRDWQDEGNSRRAQCHDGWRRHGPARSQSTRFRLGGDRRVPLTPSDDVTFIDFFVRHHEAAVEMAEHVLARGEDPDVRDLAETMRANQLQEIETMRSVREDVAGDPEPWPMPVDPRMEAEMDEMMAASGTELDRMFLEQMSAHHAAALPTAHRAKPRVENAELRAMSDDIYHSQAQEVGEMERLRTQLQR